MGEDRSDGKKIRYFYDVQGVCGFSVNDGTETKYYNYVRNVLGDVIMIEDNLGSPLLRYEYDSRGRYTVKGFAKFCRWDELLTDYERMIDEWNPFKWKSYYRDIETGYYYMNGRYYDPEAGLYIDAEDIEHLPANAVTAGGLDRNAITLDNHINIAYNDDNIFTSSELYADVTYDPDENRSWWEKHWLEFVQWALFAIAVAASLVLAACGQPQMLVLCIKSAVIAAMTYAVIVGIVTAISGGNENDMAIAMRRAMIDGFRDAFTGTALCVGVSSLFKKIKEIKIQKALQQKTEAYLQELKGTMSKKKLKKLKFATGTYDLKLNRYTFAYNSEMQGDYLTASMKDIVKRPSCAEAQAINKAVSAGSKMENLYVYTIKAETGGAGYACRDCTEAFGGRVAKIFSGLYPN